MAPPFGQQAASIIEQLFDQPHRFDFFQAVQLLQRAAEARAEGSRPAAVGHDAAPESEAVRFLAAPSLSFPAGPISRMDQPAKSAERSNGQAPAEMTVTFLGLTGPSGVLPDHYTTLLIRRARDRDRSLRDFLDLFNHRTVSLFYRAWEKYHFPTAYERSLQTGSSRDPVSQSLYSLVGLGVDAQRRRSSIDDETFVYYCGAFSHGPPTAESLSAMLSEYFGTPVEIEQFRGQWLYLDEGDRSRLPGPDCPQGSYNQLGVDVVVGERVWDIQSKFRIRIGPLNYREFLKFIPTREALEPLRQLTRSYVGAELDFEVQPVLKAAEVPMTRLSTDGGDSPHLGWNTWLVSQLGVDAEAARHLEAAEESVGFFVDDLTDAVFFASGDE